jgi:tRNA1Val (adenine37-N6)-methyltransferase
MPNNYFQFKEFTIRQEKCAMKVGTDGVLLGAWTAVNESVNRILDVGTGTGIIAIMLAQRTNAQIDAVEIDATAANQAKENILNCPWKNRIRVYSISLQKYVSEAKKNYDLIISNPPYFSNSLTSVDSERNLARHDDMLSLDELFSGISKILKEKGRFAIIHPADSLEVLCSNAAINNLFLNRLTKVFPTPQKSSIRVLCEFSFFNKKLTEDEITIEEYGRHKYSKEFISLTKDFYLNL